MQNSNQGANSQSETTNNAKHIFTLPPSPVRVAFVEAQKQMANINSNLKSASTTDVESETPVEEKPSKRKHDYVFTGNDLMQMPVDSTPHLWEPFMHKQGLVALTGSSDVGKSSLLRDFAIAVALRETTFLGHPLHVKHGKVIYYTTEENQATISESLKKQTERIGTKDLSGLCYIFNEEKPEEVIIEQLLEGDADVVIIDCFADVFKGRLNDNGSVREYLQELNEISIAGDCLFILLHHNGKRTEFGVPDKNSIIGSQAFEAKVRLAMDLRKEADGSRSLWVTKGNNIPDSMKKEGLKLSFDDNQHFTLIGKSQHVSAAINNKFKHNKPEIMMHIAEIQSRGKISQDNILLELKKIYGEKAPSKGAISGWIRERDSKKDVDGSSAAA